jgi:uncharacterized protein
MIVELIPLKDSYSIYKVVSTDELLKKNLFGEFYSISVSNEEVTVICKTGLINKYIQCEPDWNGFKIKGLLDFSLIGIIHMVTKPLKDNDISLFVISTFNTDYIFVKANRFEEAAQVLNNNENTKVIYE